MQGHAMMRHRELSSRRRLIEAAAIVVVCTAYISPTMAAAHTDERDDSGLPKKLAIAETLSLAQAKPAALSGCWRVIAGRNSASLCFTRTGSSLRASVMSVSIYPGNLYEQCQGQSGSATLTGQTVRIDMPGRKGNCLRGAKRSNSVRQRLTCQLIGANTLRCTVAAYNWDGRTVYRVRRGVSFSRVR